MNLDEIFGKISDSLGAVGRMISGSKSGYRNSNPGNLVVFNANIIVESDGVFEKIWYGDVDITKDEAHIKAAAVGCTIYVLSEMDARFDNEESPNIKNFMYKTDGTESVIPEGYTRDGDGKIMRG